MQSCPGQVDLCSLKQEHHQLTLKLRYASASPAGQCMSSYRCEDDVWEDVKGTLQDVGLVPTPNAQARGQAQVCAQVFLARDGEVVGSMVLSDRVRGDAADTVRQLQDRGYRTIMLTGEFIWVIVYLSSIFCAFLWFSQAVARK